MPYEVHRGENWKDDVQVTKRVAQDELGEVICYMWLQYIHTLHKLPATGQEQHQLTQHWSVTLQKQEATGQDYYQLDLVICL